MKLIFQAALIVSFLAVAWHSFYAGGKLRCDHYKGRTQ